MSKSQAERIDEALPKLVPHLLPVIEGEDEAAAYERYVKALKNAKELIQKVDAPAVVPDENHVADLIKRKLVRENNSPEAALQFSNLFSRFLSRRILTQKWALLYFLNQLSALESSAEQNGRPRSSTTKLQDGTNGNHRPSQPLPASHALRPGQHENRLYDEAFSRQGLPLLHQSRRAQGASSPERPPIARPREPPGHRRDLPNGQNQQHAYSGSDRPQSSEPNQHTVTETSLLRDLPFTLQGVSSTQLFFPSPTVLKLPQTLPAPLISLLHSIAEPSLLYRNLSVFVDSSAECLIGQSLRAAIGVELRQYLSLVATLESQVRRALAQVEESNNKLSLGKAGVTLKRCVIWTREATLGLRLMTVIVEESRSRKGGQVITLIHQYATAHGDPFIGNFAERILAHVTRPFYEMLRAWIYDGELSDPYNEFFVVEQDPSHRSAEDAGHSRGAATSVWEDKYALDESMIPSIITADFARRVFLIGKSLDFIRTACNDAAWVQQYSKSHSRELRYSDTTALASSIDEAYATTMSRLIHLMTSKFHFLRHLTALKKYLLLSQGDFVTLLMESLASNLDRPANSQYRHTLTAQLEHAIRGSNAQFDHPDVLRRLDARMLELSMGEIGWDVFTLEYKVDAPVDVIVSPHANIQYLKVFNFLWRVKRVEYALGSTWRRCMTGARGVLRTAAESGKSSVSADDWKKARCAIAEMTHFTRQLNYYILFEVIESAWTTLTNKITAPNVTLDDLITAHSAYLKAITRKGLLASSGQPSGSPTFASQLHELLKVMLAYRDAVEGLYAICAEEAARADERKARIDRRTAQGKWGVTDADADDARRTDRDSPMPPPPLDVGPDGRINLNDASKGGATGVDALKTRLLSLVADFRARLSALLGDLAHQPDPDLRFLGVVMNFNDVYRVVRRGRRGGVGSERSKASGAGSGANGKDVGRERRAKERVREERMERAEKGGGSG